MSDVPTRAPNEGDRSTPGAVRVEYDWAATTPSAAVVETVGVATDEDPLDLPPLYRRVDSDALDVVLDRGRRPAAAGDVRVSFTYADCEVTVASHGGVVVIPRTESG